MLMLDSPVLSNAEFDAMRAYMGDTACEVDCTFAAAEGEAGLRARASTASGARRRRACAAAAPMWS